MFVNFKFKSFVTAFYKISIGYIFFNLYNYKSSMFVDIYDMLFVWCAYNPNSAHFLFYDFDEQIYVLVSIPFLAMIK